MNFLDRPYEIQMGLYQMVLLLLFNDALSLTVEDIVQQSCLSEADVVRSLKVIIRSRCTSLYSSYLLSAPCGSAVTGSLREEFETTY